jgi:hypothetical protein
LATSARCRTHTGHVAVMNMWASKTLAVIGILYTDLFPNLVRLWMNCHTFSQPSSPNFDRGNGT